MNKNNPDIDYAGALKMLLKRLKESDEILKGDDSYKYARACGYLSGAIKSCLYETDSATYEEINSPAKTKEGVNDIPGNLYTKPGTN
jgi:hypothetical protein